MPGCLALGGPQLGDPAGGRGQGSGRFLVGCRQLGAAFVVPGDQLLDLAVLLLGPLGPHAGLRRGHAEPLDLLGGGVLAAADRTDLGPQPGEPVGPVRRSPGVLGDPAIDRGELRLGPGTLRDRRAEPVPAGGQPGLQAVLFLAELGRLPIQLGGIPAGPLGLRLRRQVVVPLLGETVRGAEPLGQCGQPEPGFLRPGQHRGVLLRGGVQLGFPAACVGQARLQRGPAGQHGGLVGLVCFQLRGQRHVVVGEQSQPRITQVSLNRDRPAGHLGLAAQRLETPAQLRGQVHQPGEIGLHRLELA